MSRIFPLSPNLNQKITVGSKEFEWNGNFWKRVRVTESDIVSSTNTALTDANSYTDTAIANLVNTAPSTLDTLNELANALDNDPNFATTITSQIAGKANISHNHTVSDITNLQTELNNKASLAGNTFTGRNVIETSDNPSSGPDYDNGQLEVRNGSGNVGIGFNSAGASAINMFHPRGSQELRIVGNTGSISANGTSLRNITISSSEPSGGNIGDIWIQV